MPTDVKIGERTVTIPNFSAYKVTRGSEIIGEISERYPEIMRKAARFERDFEEEKTTRITRSMLALPKFADLRAELEELGDGDLSAVFGEKDYIEFPQAPKTWQVFAPVLKDVVSVAQSEVALLIALVLASNRELAERDEDGTIDEYLAMEGRKLLHEMYADQALEVAIEAWSVLRDQFSARIGSGKDIAAAFAASVEEARAEVAEEEVETLNSPESPTPSPAPTDGDVARSST